MSRFVRRSDRSWGKAALRLAFLTHRWAGIVACLFFAMWFASGLVMLYVPYPSLSPAQSWARAQPIDWARVTTGPGESGRRITLEMRGDLPVWRIETVEGETHIISAQAGRKPANVDADYARRVAARFSSAPVDSVGRVGDDQWTVAGGFDRHRPLWKATLADAGGSVLYISSLTGQPVQRTTRTQRFWNWLGSVPHWLYPTVLRRDNAAWRQVVMWVSGPCIAVALTGMWIGILRMRIGRRRYRGGRITPYRGWMMWHHVSGLLGGVVLTTWIVSGWLSVDPGRAFAGGRAPEAAAHAYAGRTGVSVDKDRLARLAGNARSVEWSGDGGLKRIAIDRASPHPRWLDQASLAAIDMHHILPCKGRWQAEGLTEGCPGRRGQVLRRPGTPLHHASHGPPPLAGEERRAADERRSAPAPARPVEEVASAAMLVPQGRMIAVERLSRPDFYWTDAARLPLLRLRFDDAARTWLYIDPMSGALVQRQDATRRAYRWVYTLLHTWDWPWLTTRRPAWDAWMWFWSIAGLVMSASGVVIGWRRLRRPARREA